MPEKLTEDKLVALKTHLQELQDQRRHSLNADQQETLQDEVAKLEQQLQAQLPPDPAALEEQLRQWEARMAVEHPVLASIVSDALQKLSSMGI